MAKSLPVLFRSAIYALRVGFLIRPFVIALTLGAAAAVLSSWEEQRPAIDSFVPEVLFPSHADPAPPTPLSRDRLFIMIFNSSHARRSETSYSFGNYSLSFQILQTLRARRGIDAYFVPFGAGRPENASPDGSSSRV